MKKSVLFMAILPMILIMFFASCVSSKKFTASQANVDRLKKENASTQSQLNDCNEKAKNLNEVNTTLQGENNLAQNDLKALKALSAASKMTIADQANRLKTLQDKIQSQKDIMTKLKIQ